MEEKIMRNRRTVLAIVILAIVVACCPGSPLLAQQKPQWVPGQMGLNAGILPDPGFTYVNITINYDASTFDAPNGKSIPVTGTYNVWAVENGLVYVPNLKVLGGNLGLEVLFPTYASGSLVADIPSLTVPNLTATGGGSGLADLWLQPFELGWHLKRLDFLVGDAFMVPSGRYHPGATNNVGSGYFGNHLTTGTTLYLTKNKGTSANLFTDWEVHARRNGINGTYKTPGQAFTDEWGLGQILPLKKDLSRLLQLGGIGYDQWQITDNSGTLGLPTGGTAPASLVPHYSVHAAGGQATFILPAKKLALFFKYEHEYSASAHTLGNTLVFGGTWTWPVPKTPASTH
jgi:hypothetical protein